jgi:hypothetical protein
MFQSTDQTSELNVKCFNSQICFQLVLASALFAAALARPDGPRYGAAPVYEELPPQPFAYQYGVSDDYSKANFNKQESQDNYGRFIFSFINKTQTNYFYFYSFLLFSF